MFGTETVGRGLSFVKILTGINKTLSIANQVIPIYQQAKPMIQNAKSAFRVLKEFSAPTPSTKQVVSSSKSIPTQLKKTSSSSSPIMNETNQPVFFI